MTFIVVILLISTVVALARISGQKREVEYLKRQLTAMAERLDAIGVELQALRRQASEYAITDEKTEQVVPEQRRQEQSVNTVRIRKTGTSRIPGQAQACLPTSSNQKKRYNSTKFWSKIKLFVGQRRFLSVSEAEKVDIKWILSEVLY